MNPLNGVHSSADVQAVMVHFIIIGSSTSGKGGDVEEGDEGRKADWGDGEGLDRGG